jgi:GGDEF domain-containing protein
MSLADDLRRALDRHPGLEGGRLSASIGAAAWPPQATLAAALEEADRRVYSSKREKRGGLD